MTLNVQLMTMVSMVIGGLYLGMAHDTYERFAPIWRRQVLLRYALALGFWLIQAAILFYVLYRVNDGELRVYVFLACLLGLSIYQVFFSSSYQALLNGCLRFIKAFSRILYRVIHVVLIKPLLLFLQLIAIILKGLKRLVFAVLRILLWPFYLLIRGLFRLLPDGIKKLFHKSGPIYSIIGFIYSKLRKLVSFLRR